MINKIVITLLQNFYVSRFVVFVENTERDTPLLLLSRKAGGAIGLHRDQDVSLSKTFNPKSIRVLFCT